jgi:hypothetical protein
MTFQQRIDASAARAQAEIKQSAESARRSIGQLFRHVNKEKKS